MKTINEIFTWLINNNYKILAQPNGKIQVIYPNGKLETSKGKWNKKEIWQKVHEIGRYLYDKNANVP